LKFFTTLKKDEIDSLAIGGFDGVHKAHQKLLSYLGNKGVMFSIYKEGRGLTPKSFRSKFSPNGAILVNLDDIKSMSSKEFIDFLKDEFPKLKKIVVGYDFHFGRGREADAKAIERYFEGEVVVVDEVKIDGVSVHSKVIKKLLLEGNIKLANRLLGREYKIVASPIKGQGLGSKKLYATINLDCKDFILPKTGVYASYTTIESKKYPSVTFIGNRVTTDGEFSIESHIIDEEIETKAKRVEIEFVQYLRENREFDDLKSLKEQIKKDIDSARKLLL